MVKINIVWTIRYEKLAGKNLQDVIEHMINITFLNCYNFVSCNTIP